MAKFNSLIPGTELEDPARDFRAAIKVEQYRVGKAAVYIPSGFSWNYVPLASLRTAEDTHRSVTAGHCVTVTEIKPAVDLVTDSGRFTLNLDKGESIQKILDAIRK